MFASPCCWESPKGSFEDVLYWFSLPFWMSAIRGSGTERVQDVFFWINVFGPPKKWDVFLLASKLGNQMSRVVKTQGLFFAVRTGSCLCALCGLGHGCGQLGQKGHFLWPRSPEVRKCGSLVSQQGVCTVGVSVLSLLLANYHRLLFRVPCGPAVF